jgi:ATPase subunit of ABC transporter with duplicated ATPase domains
VVSHDRYLIERVTDQQYAVMEGGFRHLPRGVDQYLELRAKQLKNSSGNSEGAAAGAPDATAAKKPSSSLSGAELRTSQKEHAAAGRKIAKLQGQIAELHQRMGTHDQSDFAGLGALVGEQQALQEALDTVELRWLELDELLA